MKQFPKGECTQAGSGSDAQETTVKPLFPGTLKPGPVVQGAEWSAQAGAVLPASEGAWCSLAVAL